MKIFFTADIHWVTPWKTRSLQKIEHQWKSANADLLVVVGDLAEASCAGETCKLLRKIARDKPVAIVLGNHDYWLGPKTRRKYENIEEVEERYWIPATKDYGIHFLQRENLAISENQVLVGSYGHYDLGFANPNLKINGQEVTEKDYLRGTLEDGDLIGGWNDMVHIPCKRGLHEEARRQVDLLKSRVDQAGGRKILLAIHTPPFQELFHPVDEKLWVEQFYLAYAGSRQMGEFIRSKSERFEFIVCGHKGKRVGPIEVSGIKGINIGSRYGEPCSFVYDTLDTHLIKKEEDSMKIDLNFSSSKKNPKKIVWCTDPHFEFCTNTIIFKWIETIQKSGALGVILSGDITNSKNIEQILIGMHGSLEIPIYFVLGNHDCYGGSREEVQQKAENLCQYYPRLHFLDSEGVIELNPTSALVGHSGWADGKAGAGDRSRVSLNDFFHIRELAGLDIPKRNQVLQQWANEAADHFREFLPKAAQKYKNILVVTHVPPFVEACWHEGRPSDYEYLPHFSSPSIGVPIQEVAKANPDRNFVVLCGHTHGEGEAQILPNLRVYTGGAEYGIPAMNGIIRI
jgi:predicted MPP superfamily phosphohydrolase